MYTGCLYCITKSGSPASTLLKAVVHQHCNPDREIRRAPRGVLSTTRLSIESRYRDWALALSLGLAIETEN